ncbi:MAG: helix-turn-helix transcriptional regulator [Bacteroidota bacterium]
MINLRLKEMMIQKGFKATPYALVKLGISVGVARTYIYGTAKSIKFDHLELLCIYLNCTPKELIGVYDDPKKATIPDPHPLRAWIETETVFPIQRFKDFSPEEFAEAERLIREMLERKKGE